MLKKASGSFSNRVAYKRALITVDLRDLMQQFRRKRVYSAHYDVYTRVESKNLPRGSHKTTIRADSHCSVYHLSQREAD